MTSPDDEESKITLAQRLKNIPCLRNSYLYGICSGIGTGLAYFMFSSRPGPSTHVGFAGFVVTTLSYWMYCRQNYSKNEEQARLFQEIMSRELAAESLKKGEPPVSVSNTNPLPTPTNL